MTGHEQRPTHEMHTCMLAIASIVVTLRCDDPAFAAALRARYHAFALHAFPHLQVHVAVTAADAEVQGPAPDVVMEGAVIRHADGHHPSYIDVAAGHGHLVVSQPYAIEEMEYWLRVAYAILAFRAGGLLFHAAGVVHHERAFLFCGRSGSGKTTVARLSPNDIVLNDDLVVLMPDENSGWIAYATPFSNPTQIQPTGNRSAPVAGIFRLVQNKNVDLQPVNGGLALAELLANVPVLAADRSLSMRLFERCEELLRTVPVYYLHFLPDPSFWPVVEAIVA